MGHIFLTNPMTSKWSDFLSVTWHTLGWTLEHGDGYFSILTVDERTICALCQTLKKGTSSWHNNAVGLLQIVQDVGCNVLIFIEREQSALIGTFFTETTGKMESAALTFSLHGTNVFGINLLSGGEKTEQLKNEDGWMSPYFHVLWGKKNCWVDCALRERRQVVRTENSLGPSWFNNTGWKILTVWTTRCTTPEAAPCMTCCTTTQFAHTNCQAFITWFAFLTVRELCSRRQN